MMRELRDVDRKLYDDIISVSILQGTYQSAVSIRNIIPIEDYSARVKEVFNTLTSTQEIKDFGRGWFQRNNFRDRAIVPIVHPKLWYRKDDKNNKMDEPYMDEWGNDIYFYDMSPSFSSSFLQKLNLKASQRMLLFLSEEYNAKDVNYDVVVVPRMITDRQTGDKIDIVIGESVPGYKIAQKLAKGDFYYYELFGYQKVKYSNGNPVVTAEGQHIYKLINLYGDGQYGSEYYDAFKPSIMDNGTIKVVNSTNSNLSGEVRDEDIIAVYGNREEVEDFIEFSNVVVEPSPEDDVNLTTDDFKC
jgi:hypothetical protein